MPWLAILSWGLAGLAFGVGLGIGLVLVVGIVIIREARRNG